MNDWIFCKHQLPNEDEISYTTMIAVGSERDRSDEVIALDKNGNVYVGFFSGSMSQHPYDGICKVNSYTDLHSEDGVAGWSFHSYHRIIHDIVAWMPLPEPPKGVMHYE